MLNEEIGQRSQGTGRSVECRPAVLPFITHQSSLTLFGFPSLGGIIEVEPHTDDFGQVMAILAGVG
jgi:hypothetical protein